MVGGKVDQAEVDEGKEALAVPDGSKEDLTMLAGGEEGLAVTNREQVFSLAREEFKGVMPGMLLEKLPRCLERLCLTRLDFVLNLFPQFWNEQRKTWTDPC